MTGGVGKISPRVYPEAYPNGVEMTNVWVELTGFDLEGFYIRLVYIDFYETLGDFEQHDDAVFRLG